MTKSAKNFLSLLSVAVFFFFAVASAPKNGVYKDAKDWVPKDFDPNTTTLLIQTHPLNAKQNTRMEKFIEEHYPYSYEIVDTSVINSKSGKYADTKKYRFAILWRTAMFSNTQTNFNTTSNRFETSTNYQWNMWGYFRDRSTSMSYPTTRKGNVYGQIGYRPVINSIAKQFATQ